MAGVGKRVPSETIGDDFMANDNEILQGELDDLLLVEEGLSEWEVDFIDNINADVDVYGIARLTDRQKKKLHSVWFKHCF